MRVAIVHDWLYTLGGAEKVLSALVRCFPNADVFSLFDVLTPGDRARAGLPQAKTSFLQRMPAIARRHRLYLPLMPYAIEQLDMTGYDLVVSSSYAVAKGVLTGPDQLHIAYVHSPMRYAWDLQHQYLQESGMAHGVRGALARYILHRMRLWDTRTASGVDAYIANSHFVARRVRKSYGRSAAVIYPPVEIADVLPPPAARPPAADTPFYLAASRLVPYKRIMAIVQAFALMPNRRLIVAGTGPEMDRLRAAGTANVTFVGFVPDSQLRELMRSAEALVFAAEEDFGILPVEVQGEGTPVIALGRGGLRETVCVDGPDPTGMFFDTADARSIAATVEAFDLDRDRFTRAACHTNALRFSTARFEREISAFVHDRYAAFQTQLRAGAPGVTTPSTRGGPARDRHADTVDSSLDATKELS
ncbi:MAG: glycosyltransferase [Gemmatimonadaceae bacterium]|nr:glycosyltransferase [Acetobacteraceae bacterium]